MDWEYTKYRVSLAIIYGIGVLAAFGILFALTYSLIS